MTFDEFIDKLSAIDATWHLTPDGVIRNQDNECPITATCRALTGITVPVSKFSRASDLLGLDWKIASYIALAADIWDPHGYSPNFFRMYIRGALIRACKLENLCDES